MRRTTGSPIDPKENRHAVTCEAVILGLMAFTALIVSVAAIRETKAGDSEVKPARTTSRGQAAAVGQQELPSQEQFDRNWPAFRGPLGTGVVLGGQGYRAEWDAASGRNILWKAKVPLPGHGSPIVWEDMVFVAGGNSEQREVYCFDAASGALRWNQAVGSPRRLDLASASGFAPSTLVTDGQRVFSVFPTGDVAAFDFAGRRLWQTNLGTLKNAYGHASSLLTCRGRLIIQLDQGDATGASGSVLLALDAATGQRVWQASRPVFASWSSPILAQLPAGAQIITCGNPFVIAYDPESGKEIWRVRCLAREVTPSPVAANGFVYACNQGATLVAIRPGGQGDVTDSHIAWRLEEGLPDIVSPLVTGDLVFMVTTAGTITCCDARDGRFIWDHDLEVEVKASPALVGQRIYLLDTAGVMHILEAGRAFKEIARATLAEECIASPAFAANRIYIRTKEHLVCVE
ncbi:MAG: PQQ-binding-like beta-propeller repeat protein [Planctomycetota bacterium]|nr:PQQ-binding-like beta-propeller repeat protein [Planctomycetota bacterium]